MTKLQAHVFGRQIEKYEKGSWVNDILTGLVALMGFALIYLLVYLYNPSIIK